jgi:hypothetical protein
MIGEIARSTFARIRSHTSSLLIGIIIIAGAVFRLSAYGDSCFAIGTADTHKFITASRFPLWSKEFFTSNRPATIALLYKLFEPTGGYENPLISEPALYATVSLPVQVSFCGIVKAQRTLAILAWSTLSISFARRLRKSWLKIAGVITVLAFAYSPQLVDWDRVLMSEAVAIHLYALLLALTLELASRVAEDGKSFQGMSWILVTAWLLTWTLYIFSRDSSAYTIPLTLLLIIPLILVPRIRSHLPWKVLLVICSILTILFGIHSVAFRSSNRWEISFFNNLIYNVFPNPARLEFLKSQGMPVSDDLLALGNSRGNERGFYEHKEFIDWTRKDGYSAYTRLMISEPRWVFGSLLNNAEYLFSETIQPYFHETPENTPLRMLPIGNLLHPKTSMLLLLNGILFAIIAFAAIQNQEWAGLGKVWFFTWMYAGALIMLFVGFHGDALGSIRHVLTATIAFRLMVWLLVFTIFDLTLSVIPKGTKWTKLNEMEF